MDLLSQYEYPLPVLNISIDKLALETSGSHEGAFRITNSGGGLLNGKIFSKSDVIHFTPDHFEGNDTEVHFVVNLSIYKPGETVKTEFVIMSSGGEIIIPVIIKVLPWAIVAKDGTSIASLKDFMSFSKEEPVLARQLFMSREFMMWLFQTGYPYMDAYETFVKDPNKERALDNFFIISKMKNKTAITPQSNASTVEVLPNETGLVAGKFELKRNGWGYVECKIRSKTNPPWLHLPKKTMQSTDFGKDQTCIVDYLVDASKIKGQMVSDTLVLESGKQHRISINVKKKPLIKVQTSKEYYSYDEKGYLKVWNGTGKDIYIDIYPHDSYIRFEGERYFIGEYAEVPFEVKPSPLQFAALTIKKQPYVQTHVLLKTYIDTQLITKVIPLTVGD